MLLEKIMFESGKTLYFRLRLEDLPMKIKNQCLSIELKQIR
jgi:hypothetical protein